MPVIDLGIEQQVPEAQPQPVDVTGGNIINLDTGKLEQVAPAPTPNDFVLDNQPASALHGLTPEEAANLPEIGYLENKLALSGENGKSFKLALGSMLSSDPAQQIEIIQNVLPDAKINTFESGETVVDYQGEQFILNKPGFSATDATRFLGQFVAFLPAGKISTLGREGVKKLGAIQALKPIATSAAKQRMGQVAAAAAANATTSAALDIGAAQMAGDESTQGVSGERAAISGIFGGAAELIGPAFRGIVSKFRGTPDDLKYIDLDSVRQLKEAEKQTGISLFEPQATQARSDSLYMRVLQDLPETQRQMLSLLHDQNAQASGAVTNFLADIAEKSAIETAPKQVRNLAISAIDDMKTARSNLVSQGYREAFAAGTKVDVAPVVAQVDNLLSKTSSSSTNPVRRELLQAKDQLLSDAQDGLVDLQILHSVKMNMDDAINSFGDTGPTGQAKNALREIKEAMVSRMDEASPLYDQVKSIYRDASGPINELENSLIGKVAGIKDNNMKSVLTSLFDPTQSNPAVLRNAREVIQAKDPEAWNAILRAQLESQMGKMSTRAIEGAPNTPNLLLGAIFGKNEIQRKMIMDSFSAEQRGSARWLEMALKAAARGRTAGSDTAGKTEAIKTLKGGVDSFSEYLNPLNWSNKLTGAMKQAKFERRAQAFVDAMTNSEWSAEMAKLKQMNPTDSAAARAFTQLLTRIESGGVENETFDKKDFEIRSSQ